MVTKPKGFTRYKGFKIITRRSNRRMNSMYNDIYVLYYLELEFV